jgi:hypothetical protein
MSYSTAVSYSTAMSYSMGRDLALYLIAVAYTLYLIAGCLVEATAMSYSMGRDLAFRVLL